MYIAIRTLKRNFASTFKNETRSITLILYTFSIAYTLRTGYESYENVRNLA